MNISNVKEGEVRLTTKNVKIRKKRFTVAFMFVARLLTPLLVLQRAEQACCMAARWRAFSDSPRRSTSVSY